MASHARRRFIGAPSFAAEAVINQGWMRRLSVLAPSLPASLVSTAVQTWSPQGHRLVAVLAANHRASPARQRVAWLLGDASLSDVSVRADGIPVSVFGSATCTYDDGTAYPCNLPHRSVGTER